MEEVYSTLLPWLHHYNNNFSDVFHQNVQSILPAMAVPLHTNKNTKDAMELK